MGREVRRVPADWQHPQFDEDNAPRSSLVGSFIPLHGYSYDKSGAEWDEARAKWEAGFVENYGKGEKWRPKDTSHTGRYTEYAGPRPSPDDHMPDWPEAERTHLMMYETTSEGTPLSPAFATPEELARWLADNGASAFADQTATYEQWLNVARGGWAPSAAVIDGKVMSGVAALAEEKQ